MSRSEGLRRHAVGLGRRAGRLLVRRAGFSRRRRPLTQYQAGLKHGWRSGLEAAVAAQLTEAGTSFSYEEEVLDFVQPAKARKYTPDFVVTTRSGKKLYIETKGLWERDDRLKMKLVCEQHADKDIRFVFNNPRARISKRSATTYAGWCERVLKCKWAKARVPEEWLDE